MKLCENCNKVVKKGGDKQFLYKTVKNCSICSNIPDKKINQFIKMENLLNLYKKDQPVLNEKLFSQKLKAELSDITQNRGIDFKKLFVYPIVLAFLIFGAIFVNSNFINNDTGVKLISTKEVISNKPITIDLGYLADQKLNNVKFSIKLDKGLTFYSSHSEIVSLKNHSWIGNLKKGENKIPFVVTALKDGKWTIYTEAQYQGYKHKHKIILDVKKGKTKVSYFKLPDQKIEIY